MAKGIEQVLGDILTAKKKTIAVAESCTGGAVSDLITNAAGSSVYFIGGIVAYSNQAKMEILKIPEKIIEEDGQVSRACALTMAQNIRSLLRTDIGVGVTGIAGPSGGYAQKPVGSVFIAVADGEKSVCRLYKLEGKRDDIKKKAKEAVLRMVKEFVGG